MRSGYSPRIRSSGSAFGRTGARQQAFDEAIRLESPVTGFTRVTTRASEIGSVDLPAGARVLVSYASANRNERYWDDSERFDVERPNASHVAFGFGEHACAGMGLARLEATAVLTALASRVERFELAGTPVRKLNNVIRAFGSLPVRIVSGRSGGPMSAGRRGPGRTVRKHTEEEK